MEFEGFAEAKLRLEDDVIWMQAVKHGHETTPPEPPKHPTSTEKTPNTKIPQLHYC
jgi:hypothetical protein